MDHFRQGGARPPERCAQCPLRPPPHSSSDSQLIEQVQSARVGTVRLWDGDIIHGAGEMANRAFTLFDGYAVRYRLLPDGGRQVTTFLLPGDLMICLESEGGRWADTAEVIHHAVLCELSAAKTAQLFDSTGPVAQAIALIRDREERILAERLTDLGRRPALDRVARLLLELFHRQNLRGKVESGRCFLPFKQQDLGDGLGLSAVHISRMATSLRAMNLMDLDRRWLSIPHFERTADAFDYVPANLHPRVLL